MPSNPQMMLLSPQYEEEYVRRYGKQPKFIPVDFVSNHFLPRGIEVRRNYSRVWIKNAKSK